MASMRYLYIIDISFQAHNMNHMSIINYIVNVIAFKIAFILKQMTTASSLLAQYVCLG